MSDDGPTTILLADGDAAIVLHADGTTAAFLPEGEGLDPVMPEHAVVAALLLLVVGDPEELERLTLKFFPREAN